MSSLVLTGNQTTPLPYTIPLGTANVPTNGIMTGGYISVTQKTILKGLGWNNTGPLADTDFVLMGVWDHTTGNLLGTTTTNKSGQPMPFASPITLVPTDSKQPQEQLYYIGVYVPSGRSYSLGTGRTLTPPVWLKFGVGEWRDLVSGLQYPPTAATGSGLFEGDFIFDAYLSSLETKTEPPEPIILAGSFQFTIGLPTDWMPATLKEWDLQFQRSYDNSKFGPWIDIGTFPSQTVPDSLNDSDTEPDAIGIYTHAAPDTTPPYPYYRYRYRLRTTTQESEWSEAGLAGEVRNNADTLNNPVPANTIITGGTVDGTTVGTGTITGDHIAANTITAANITANTITATQIAATTITAGQIAANTITATQIAASTITTNEIASHTITAADIAAATITATEIASHTITANQITAATITATEIAANTITAAKIAAGTITATEIAASTITAGKLNITDLSAITASMGTLTSGTIQGGIIRTASSGSRVVMGNSFVVNGVTYSGIAGVNASEQLTFIIDSTTGNVQIKGAILSGSSGLGNISGQIDGTTNIVATSIQASRLNVSTLSAITADLGTITAGTVTGATFRTASSNPKVQMDSTGINAYDSGGVNTVHIPSDGTTSTFTGYLQAQGLDIFAKNWTIAGAPAPAAANAVEWKRTSDSAVISQIGELHVDAGAAHYDDLQLRAIAKVGEARQSQISLRTVDDSTGSSTYSGLTITHTDGGATSGDKLTAQAGSSTYDLLRGDGTSDFMIGAGKTSGGRVAIATTESRTNTAYGLLTTADRVQNVVVPANALVRVWYWALWQNSVASAGRAAIFIGSNQLQHPNNPANTVNEALGNATAAVNVPLFTTGRGLDTVSTATAFPAPPTTGSVYNYSGATQPGGMCSIFNVPAGTYDISVQFKSSSGSVTVSNRLLIVQVVAIP